MATEAVALAPVLFQTAAAGSSDRGPDLVPVGDEARQRMTAVLRVPKSGLPTELLCAHVERGQAEAGFAVALAAAEAVRRRWQIAADEGLRVVRRPRGPFGDYQTARRGQSQRPWTTRLYELEPLRASCGCPDFCANSLGVCKHVLVVLADVHRRVRTSTIPRRSPAAATMSGAPQLWWDPHKPLAGAGDWLARVHLRGTPRGRPSAAWRALLEASRGLDGHRVLAVAAGTAQRRDLVQALGDVLRRSPDPALSALVAAEQERLATADALAPLAGKPMPKAWKRRLFAYQEEGVARFLATGRLLLADDMGLGKTTQALAIVHRLRHAGLVRRGLLVVPASLKGQWQREWQACHDLPLVRVEGSPEQRAAIYRARNDGFLLVNYEQLLRDIELARAFAPDFVLLDEAQRIKNWETRTAATIKQLQPRFRLVLTGTPFENRLPELDSILEWLDRRPLEPVWRLVPFHQLDEGRGLRHLDVLRERLSTVLIRRRRQEVLDQLPGRTDTRLDVPLTDAQRLEHDDRMPRIAQLLAKASRRPLLRAEFLALMQLFTQQRIVANGLAQMDFDAVWPGIERARPTAARLESLCMPKLGELRALLQQVVVEQGRKVVVFSQWRRALQLAAWACGDLFAAAGVRGVFFTGAESPSRRDANVVAFHDDPNVRVLFATDAGGVGLNLQKAASCCVHFDLPWNPAVFEQRVGRVWRLGQTSKVEVWSLVGEECIESRIAGVLAGKHAAFKAVLDGTSDEVVFERQQGFLAAARRVAGDGAVVAGGAAARAEAEGDVVRTDEGGAAEAEAAIVVEAEATAAVGAGAGTKVPEVRAPQVQKLLAGLQVTARADGGLVVNADRESAGVLVELLRGLASAIEGGVAGKGVR